MKLLIVIVLAVILISLIKFPDQTIEAGKVLWSLLIDLIKLGLERINSIS